MLQDCLTAFMEDIISHMAGYVPLKAIAERILLSYASDPFGDFKVTPQAVQYMVCRALCFSGRPSLATMLRVGQHLTCLKGLRVLTCLCSKVACD